ncbi:glycosyltransferase [Mesorhizobium sp.]|uniref:glycosyltransferase n=1 Tax=Mesorhizobium sp. TaxID=1871066 RepID=UPI000FE9B2F8|nr:glycosyltransferase [Mesorhizobium sp.]RWO52436.1 MAG: glycosyltransferase [Mesorhizobium sp.]
MNSPPPRDFVSIIIPNWNGGLYLRGSIRSALSQDYELFEVIVVDDGSTDGSVEAASNEFERIRVVSQARQGAAAARNRGLDEARGRFIVFLDSDDQLLPTYLSSQVKFSKTLSNDMLSVCDRVYMNSDLTETLRREQLLPLKVGESSVSQVVRQIIQTSSPMHRREALDKVGGFDPTLKQGQERDLHLRLALAGYSFVRNPFVGLKIREHDSSGRISNQQFARSSPFHDLDRINREYQRIVDGMGANIERRIIETIAKRYWAGGRRCIRAGRLAEAEIYFDAARSCGVQDYLWGGWVYRALCRMFGPVRAERLRLTRFHR